MHNYVTTHFDGCGPGVHHLTINCTLLPQPLNCHLLSLEVRGQLLDLCTELSQT